MSQVASTALMDLHAGKPSTAEYSSSRKDELVTRVKKAIAQLQSSGKPITQRAIGTMVGVHVRVLLTYPRVKALLKHVASINHADHRRAQQALLSEDALVARVEKAVEQLESLGKPVTQRAVSAIIGVPASSLYYYTRVITLIKGAIKDKRRQSMAVRAQQREEELVANVLGAVEDLRAGGRAVSLQAIAKTVHITVAALRRYPRVEMLLAQVVNEGREKRNRKAQ